MPNVKISAFTGIAPRTGPSLLQANQAQVANNVKLQSGEIRAWRKPVFTFQPVNSAVSTIYKHVGAAGVSQWLEWTTDVDVVASPIADTTDYRLYYTGQGTPKKTNYALASSGSGAKPQSYLEMGIPAPTVAPTLSATGGTAPTEVRAYVYTYVSTFGAVKEESAPSPAALVTCNAAGATVSVSGFGTAPFSTGGINYNITAIRIYRVVSGATTASYFQVDEIAVTPATGVVASGTSVNGVAYTSTYPDTRTVAQLTILLPSLYYTPPPAGLTGLVAMPNGILAGFTGNQIYFCEPYYPHAWPSSYSLTTEFPIVGLGVFGTTLFVGTTKNPYLITGTSPASMTQEKLSMVQPCVAKRSIVFDQFGIAYAGPDGLVAIGPGVQDIITSSLYTRDDWQQLVPSSFISTLYRNSYMGFYNNGTIRGGIVLARNDNPPLTTFDFQTTALFVERSTGSLYGVSVLDNAIYQIDADPSNNVTYDWKSKRFMLPEPTNFAILAVDGDFVYLNDVAALVAAGLALNSANAIVFAASSSISLGGCINDIQLNTLLVDGSNMTPLSPNQVDVRSIQLIVYADGQQIMTTTITSNEPVRMPSGFKSYAWEIEFSGNVPIRSIGMSTSVTELANETATAQLEYRTV